MARNSNKDTLMPKCRYKIDMPPPQKIGEAYTSQGQVDGMQQDSPERGDPSKVSFLNGINKWLLLLLKE